MLKYGIQTTLKGLVDLYGKDKLNTFTKYPSILTLHKLGPGEKLLNELTTLIQGEELFGTEKIDGTNVRLISLGSDLIVGSRDNLLFYSNDIFYDPIMNIVDNLKALNIRVLGSECLTVVYGEMYGGKISSKSKHYGTDKIGFRVFDVVEYKDLSILVKSREQISRWREHETKQGIVYGQNFLTRNEIKKRFPYFELVPEVKFELGDMSHTTVLEKLKEYIPSTNVALSENALKKPEGVVLRNRDRTKIVKIRYEDYERTLRFQKVNN